MTKTIIISGRVVTLYRVHGFAFPSWTSDPVEAENITERRIQEWTAIKCSGSKDVKSTLAELEIVEPVVEVAE